MRDRLILVAAILFGVLSIFGLYTWNKQNKDVVEALVAKQFIPRYTVITKDMLGTKLIPRESLDTNSFQNPNHVLDKINMVELWPGEQLIKEKFDIADIKPKPGEVLIGVETDLAKAVGGELQPGDSAELKVRYKPESGRRDTITVLEDVKIFSIKDSNGQALGGNEQNKTTILPFNQTTSTDTKNGNTTPSYIPAATVKTMPKVIVIRVKDSDSNKVIDAAGLGELVFAKLP